MNRTIVSCVTILAIGLSAAPCGVSASLRSLPGNPCKVRCGEKVGDFPTTSGTRYLLDSQLSKR